MYLPTNIRHFWTLIPSNGRFSFQFLIMQLIVTQSVIDMEAYSVFLMLACWCSLACATNNVELPRDLRDPVLFCEGCYATMYEIDAMMIKTKHEKLNQRITNAINAVCHKDHLRKYVFSPPKMEKVLYKDFQITISMCYFRCAKP